MRKLPMVSRREFFTLAAAAGLSVSNPRGFLASALADKTVSPVNPDQALRDLLDGNKRFMAHLLGPTGGYLMSYPAAASLIAYLWKRSGRGFSAALASAAIGNVVILLCGFA